MQDLMKSIKTKTYEVKAEDLESCDHLSIEFLFSCMADVEGQGRFVVRLDVGAQTLRLMRQYGTGVLSPPSWQEMEKGIFGLFFPGSFHVYLDNDLDEGTFKFYTRPFKTASLEETVDRGVYATR
jgi:hypothetical protein